MLFTEIQIADQRILYDSQFITKINTDWFNPQFWEKQDKVMGYAHGRATVTFFQYNDQQCVLRHYHRGGVIAAWLGDKYVWCGLPRSRPWRELRLLGQLQDMRLPVPQPIAARIIKKGFFYTADIITIKIPDTISLAEKISQNDLPLAVWTKVGKIIKQFHKVGLDHSDMNAHNILLDDRSEVHLIDFDKCTIRKTANHWQRNNLQRLQRSLEKLKGLHKSFYFTEHNWASLIQGYQSL